MWGLSLRENQNGENVFPFTNKQLLNPEATSFAGRLPSSEGGRPLRESLNLQE